MQPIVFNHPVATAVERAYIDEALSSTKHSGDGVFTKRCHEFFEKSFGFGKALLTTSGTDALELAALLLNIAPGDEVIVPSFTFVSSANAFALRGAKLVFADSSDSNPNVSAAEIEPLITKRTVAICVVHYAGVACDMDPILALAERHGIAVIEDAAQAINSFYKGRALGGLGRFGAFSFHETKNVSCGEGGLFIARDAADATRAEILREKGTNRSAFFRGEVDKYGWIDVGSSFLPSDILAAYLAGQLDRLEEIQGHRTMLWQAYKERLAGLPDHGVTLPDVPRYATNNAHMFYLVCANLAQRGKILTALREQEIHAAFHYISLHSSPYFAARHDGRALPNSDRLTDGLLRLPLHMAMSRSDADRVADVLGAAFR